MKHLTDYEIQAWIEGNPEKNCLLCKAHLSKCSECQERLEIYQTLYAIIEKSEQSLNIPNNFIDRVMAELPRRPLWRNHAVLRDKIGWLTAVMYAIGIVISAAPRARYFHESSKWIHRFDRICHSVWILLHRFADSFSETVIWLICGIVILFCLMSLDQFFMCRWRIHFNSNQ